MHTPQRSLAQLIMTALVVTSLLPTGVMSANAASSFSDVESGSWYQDAISEFVTRGIIGADSATFRPSAHATRAEVVKIILGAKGSVVASSIRRSSFVDVSPADWFAPYIEKAATEGWLKGDSDCYDDGSERCTVRAEDSITRAEVAAMTIRAFELSATAEAPVFSDNPVRSWFHASVQTAADRCILRGDGQKSEPQIASETLHASGPLVRPLAHIIRAEAVVMISRASEDLRYGEDCSFQVTEVESPVIYALAADGTQYSFGAAKDGQILTYSNGRISWQDAPASTDADFQTRSGYGRMPSTTGGGERHYGGGGSTSSSTTTVVTSGDGLSEGDADGRYVNVSGDTMAGGLVITHDGLGLNVTGTISGSTLHAEKTLSVSGATILGGTLSIAGVTYSFPGGDGASSGKVLKTDGAGQLSWADDTAVGTGLDQSSGDARYVNTSGDTMTGVLVINITGGDPLTLGLNVRNTISGSRLIVSGNASISGALLVKNNLTTLGTLSGSNLTVSQSASISGTLIVKTGITSKGSLSGSTFYGAGLGSCTGASQKLLYNSSTGTFSCGTISASSSFGTGNVLTIGDARYVRKSGDTMTGALIVQATLSGRHLIVSQTASFSGALMAAGNATVKGTLSGSRLVVSGHANISGTLLVLNGITSRATVSGSNLYASQSITGTHLYSAQTFGGAGLADCDTAGTSKLLWDSTTKRFSCGTDTDTNTQWSSTGALQTAFDSRYVNQSGDTMTGALSVRATLSGSRLVISGNANITGSLLTVGGITTRGTLSGSNLTVSQSASISGTLIVKTGITSKGSVSGSTIDGFGLGSCNGGSQKLLYNSAIDKFECGTISASSSSFGTGNVVTIGDDRYVRTAGDTMTGSLIVQATLSGRHLIVSQTASFSGALVAAGNATVKGTLSGSRLVVSNNANISGTLLVLNGITSKATVSGANLYASKSITGTHLYSAQTFGGAGLATCNGSTEKLLYNATTKRFECGSDLNTGVTSNWSNTGSLQTAFDSRYVNQSGDTMTGALSVRATLSGSRLVISGNANITGSLLTVGGITTRGTLSGSNLTVSHSASISGTLIVKTGITSKGSVSGSTIDGFGLGSCNGASEKLLYNSSTDKFECGTISASSSSFGTGNVLTIGDARYLKRSGGTMTGQLVVDITGGNFNTIGLKVINTLSGAHLHAERTLSTSGSLVFEGAASGSSLYIATSLQGAGLTSCSDPSQKLLWNSATGRFSCGTDQSASSGLGQNEGDARYVNQSGDTMTGALIVQATMSGRHLIVSQTASISGALVVAGNATVKGTFSGSRLVVSGHANISGTLLVLNGITSRATVSGSNLYAAQSISGSYLYAAQTFGGAGLATCNGSTEKLLYNATTKRFECGTDLNTGGSGSNWSNTGSLQTAFDSRYVNQSGDTMTGILIVKQTISGSRLTISENANISGSLLVVGNITTRGTLSGRSLFITGTGSSPILYTDVSRSWVGIGTTAPKATLEVKGTISGSNITVSRSASISGSLLVRGTIATKGTLSGAFLTIQSSATISGSLLVKNSITSKGSISGSSLLGFGLGSCNAGTSKLLYNNATNKFECGTITATPTTFGTGNVLTISDARYVRKSGDTMTGSLLVQGTLSGRHLIISQTASFSGALVAAGNATVRGTLSGSRLVVSGHTNISGTLLVLNGITSKATVSGSNLYAAASITGSHLYSAQTFGGAGLADCDTAGTSKLLWNSTTKRFSCGTDADTNTQWSNTGALQTAFDSRYVNQSGDTMTGALLVKANLSGSRLIISENANISGALLTIGNITSRGTLSGSNLTVSRSASISGTLIVKTGITSKGSVSGATIDGFGLGSCNGGTDKLLYNSTTDKFECGTISASSSSFGTGNVLTIGDARYVRKSGDTMTGALVVQGTLSGRHLIVSQTASFSGAVIAQTNVTVKGTLSGSSVYGFGLGDCSASNKKLTYNNSTGKFSCADDLTAGSGLEYSTASAIFVNQSGDTMTGALVIDLTGGNPNSLGLNVRNTISGSRLIVSGHANISGSLLVLNNITTRGTLSGSNLTVSRSASISGTLIVKTGITSKGSVSGSTLLGFGLGSCNGASQKLLYNNATNKFECGTITASSSSFSTGNVLTIGDARYVKKSGDTMTGALTINLTTGHLGLRIIQTASGNIIHAEKSLSSSGTLVWEGAGSGNSLTLAGGNISFASNGAAVFNEQGRDVDFRIESDTDTEAFLVDAGNNRVFVRADGDYAFMPALNSETVLVVGDVQGSHNYLSILAESEATAGINFGDGGDEDPGSIFYDNSNDILWLQAGTNRVMSLQSNAIVLNEDSDDVDFRIESNGLTHALFVDGGTDMIGIGKSTPKALLDVLGTISGSRLSISGNANITGALLVKNNITARGTISGSNLTVSRSASISGTLIVKTGITSKGSVSGSTIDGFGLGSCNGASEKLLYNSTSDKFECGTISASASAFSTGNVLTIGDARYVRTAGGTMTGTLILNPESGLALNARGTISGSRLVISNNANISGTLLVLNGITSRATVSGSNLYAAASITGSHLYVAQTFGGAGLADCDTAGTSKLLWDSTTKKFSCGTDQTGGSGTFGSGNVLTISDDRYVRTAGDTMTGALAIQNGNTHTPTSTPLLNVRGTMSGRSLYISGTGSSPILYTDLTRSWVGIGTTAPKATLEVKGTISGSNITVSRSASISGSLLVRGTIATKGTLSGAFLTIQSSATISGSLLVKNSITSKGSVSGSTLFGFGLGDCSASDKKLVYNNSTGKFSCASDQTGGSGTFGTGNVLTIGDARYVNQSGDTMTGSLSVRATLSGSRLVISGNANITGALLVKGNLTSRGTMSGTNLTVSRSASISGTLLVKTSITSKGSLSGSSVFGLGLGDCSNTTTSKLIYNNSTGKFACATDQSGASSGLSFSTAQGIYVNQSGDTMTGALVINMTNGNINTIGLSVINTLSGAILHAERGLTSSGYIFVTQSTIRGSGALVVRQNTNSTGAYITSLARGAPVLALENNSGSLVGAGRAPHILFGYKGTFDVSLFRSTGAVLNLSGSLLPSITNKFDLGSSARRFRSLYLSGGTIFLGNSSNDSAIHYNTSASRFGIDLANNGSDELSILSNGNVGIGTNNPKASLDVAGTISGARLSISGNANISGSIIVVGGGGITTRGTLSGSNLTVSRSASISGTLIVKTGITSKGSISGSTIDGFGLGSCNGGSSKLLYNATTDKFECGTITGGGSSFGTGNVLTIGDARYLRRNGGTMTGQLIVDITGGNFNTIGLKVVNTLSGAHLHAERTLSSSGTLIVKGNATFDTNTLFLDATNNRVGIGTATPSAALEVFGQIIDRGNEWTARGAAEANGWQKVAYGNGLFVAVGWDGTNRVMTSPDGITWTARSAAEANGWDSVTYGNGLFVAVAYDGTNRVMTSPDGITWTARSAAGSATWKSITYGNGLFVAVASTGTNRVMTSPDGITWTARSAAEANSWLSVTYGNGLFVAVADSGTNRVMTSSNGITWTARSASEANGWVSVTYGNGLFVAISYGGTNRVMTSSDGITWTARSASEGNIWQNVTYGNGLFVAVASTGTNRVMTSPDGITWTARSAAEDNAWRGITYGNGLFVAVADSGTNRVMTSGKTEITALVHNNIYQGGMTINGNVGIGTGTNLIAKATVYTDNNFDQDAFLIRSRETSASVNMLKIVTDVSSTNNTVFRVSASGAVYADGQYNSAGADYAEWFRSAHAGSASDRALEAGEVVCIDVTKKNTVKRCDRDADSNVMGIVSSNPSFVGNVITGADGIMPPGYSLIGLIGQVPANVVIEGSGSIRAGDSLTAASIPGYARRANTGESTVGVALEGFEGVNGAKGTVNVLISRRNSSLTVDAVGQKVLDTIASMKIGDEVQMLVSRATENLNLDATVSALVSSELSSLDLSSSIRTLIKEQLSGALLTFDDTDLRAQIAALSVGAASFGSGLTLLGSTLDDLSTRISTIESTLSGSIVRFGSGKTLHAAAATIDRTLTVNGALHLSGSLVLSKNATIGSMSFSGSEVQIGSLMSSGALKVIGSITIAGLAEFFGDVHIYGELMLSNRQAGFAVIPKTGTSVTVHWDPPMTGTPVVTATPDTPVLYAVTKVSATGFTIRIAGTADEQIMFSYIALSADAPLTAMGAGKTPVVATPFPVNELGQPVSFDPIWNGCIQGRAVLDADGQPYSCARYREDFTWQHPDLGISFIYNPNHEPPILTLPEGYVVTVIVSSDSTPDNSEPAPESPPDEPVTEPEETPPDDTDTPPDSTTDDTDTPPDSTTDDTESPPDTTSDNTEPATDASPPSSETEPAASGEKSGSSVEAIPVTESADPAPPPTE